MPCYDLNLKPVFLVSLVLSIASTAAGRICPLPAARIALNIAVRGRIRKHCLPVTIDDINILENRLQRGSRLPRPLLSGRTASVFRTCGDADSGLLMRQIGGQQLCEVSHHIIWQLLLTGRQDRAENGVYRLDGDDMMQPFIEQ